MNAQLQKVAQALQKNNMAVYGCETAAQVADTVRGLLKAGQSIGVGGSETLKQTGVLQLIREPQYRFYDRFAPGLTREQVVAVMKQSLTADVFISSVNAVTEQGELFNVDGNGNRVAPIIFGPDSVILVVGANKIVPDIPAAVQRLKTVAAPLNAKRLNCQTPCQKTGECVSLSAFENAGMCAGCNVDDRICCSYTVLARQRVKNRIKVVLCEETLGF